MAMNRRTMLMRGAAAVLATTSPVFAQEQERGMVLRRPIGVGEDPSFYAFTQPGGWLPTGEPVIAQLGMQRLVIHYPRYTLNARVVVFSHGALGDPQMYRLLIDHWVSHGFVVIAPVHDDSVFERGLLARVTSASGHSVWEIDRILNDSVAWDARCESCRAVLDNIDRLAQTVEMEFNIERPIIIGHEFGSYVAQLLLGAKVTTEDGTRRDFGDPRWFSGMLLSAQGKGIMGLDEASWENITRPMIVIQGALEQDFTKQQPAEKMDPFSLSTAGNKHLAWFKNGDRLLYSGPRAGTGQVSAHEFENLKGVTAAFNQAYGNYDSALFTKLAGNWLDRATADTVQTRYR